MFKKILCFVWVLVLSGFVLLAWREPDVDDLHVTQGIVKEIIQTSLTKEKVIFQTIDGQNLSCIPSKKSSRCWLSRLKESMMNQSPLLIWHQNGRVYKVKNIQTDQVISNYSPIYDRTFALLLAFFGVLPILIFWGKRIGIVNK
ncbi:MAG: hypothetical protein ACRCV6_10875 [Formosimonas sp.]